MTEKSPSSRSTLSLDYAIVSHRQDVTPTSPSIRGHSTCCEIVPTALSVGFVLRKTRVDKGTMNHNIPACIVASLRSTVRLSSPGLRPMEQHAAWKAII